MPRHPTAPFPTHREPRSAGPGRRVGSRARGSIYIFVLGTALLVTVIGLSAIIVARINTRRTGSLKDQPEAMALGLSAVEAAVAAVNNDPDWRTNYLNDTETPAVQLGNGTISWKLVDEDGDLADDPMDAVRVYGIGRVNENVWVYSAILSGLTPLEALRTCLHASNQLHIKSGKSLRTTGARASTNANFRNDGTLFGSIDAATRSGSGSVMGIVNVPASPKGLPPAQVFSLYAGKATPIPYSGSFDRVVLTPTLNEYAGGLNPDGVYYIDTGGRDLVIKGSRIHGTLVVNAGTKRVVVDDQVFLHNYRSDYPVLIVAGELALRYTSKGLAPERYLRESAWGHNFNPPGAPYDDETDGDTLDRYPSEIHGLVHVIGKLVVRNNPLVRGVILCEDTVTIEDSFEIVHDPRIPHNPPEGYTSADGELVVSRGSWKREPGQ